VNFNSPEFLLFLPAVMLLYTAVFRRESFRNVLLLCASYAFYMSWNWKYAGLIALSTLVDYLIGRRMGVEERPKLRRLLLVISLVVNLGLLGVFKYYNFFIDLSRDTFSLFGLDLSVTHHQLLLPVGISFYTFQTLSYTIDLYRKEIGVERSLLKFAVFVSFFPQLVAGPIVRAREFLPQLNLTPRITAERVHYGMWRVFRGLFKKIVIADLLAGLAVDGVFARPGDFSSLDLLMALYAYAFQIYNDFSGYSDIAIGAACMLGFKIPENFNRPYLAQNVREFWTRWHISLSSWLRDYLYISLGGNRGTRRRTSINLMATMLLGGLWHGAALNFVFWGAYHGLLLAFSRKSNRRPGEVPLLVKVRRRVVCFHLVLIGWLLFRVTSFENLIEYLAGLAQLSGGTQLHPYCYAILLLGAVMHFLPQDGIARLGKGICSLPVPVQAGAYTLLLLVFSALTMQAPAFIYFQF